MGGRSMKDVGGAVLAGSSPPFLGRERAVVDVERRCVLFLLMLVRMMMSGAPLMMFITTPTRFILI